LVAAFCFLIAIATTLFNLTLTSQVREQQQRISRGEERETTLARELAVAQAEASDLENPNAVRYDVQNGQVVESGDRIYIVLHNLPMPARGKVYQAWVLARKAKKMTPSVTFIPDKAGVAVVALAYIDASRIGEVGVSIEPDAGAKTPAHFLFEIALQ
jgi:hypothetical protein